MGMPVRFNYHVIQRDDLTESEIRNPLERIHTEIHTAGDQVLELRSCGNFRSLRQEKFRWRMSATP